MNFRVLILFFISITALLILSFCQAEKQIQSSKIPNIKNVPVEVIDQDHTLLGRAPDFEFTDIKGQKNHLAAFKGRAVFINFWASWCPPCVAEMPLILNQAKENPDMIFLLLSSDRTLEKIQNFLKKPEMQRLENLPNILIIHDTDRKITANLWKSYQLPESYLIRPNGEICQKIIGDIGTQIAQKIKQCKGL